MSSIISELENHMSFQLAAEMQQVCEPIYKALRINYVDYAKFYPDGRLVTVYSDKQYFKSFVKDFTSNNTPNKLITTGMHLWSSYIASDFLFQASRQFQHSHGITVLNELKDYSEIINLATHPENIQILSFYLNQQPILHQLINYVRTHTRKMINKIDDNPFIIPGRHQPHAEQHPYDKLSLDFLKESATFDIQINNITISLSKREAQCLHYLYQGKTSKEIGKALAISHRTIEIYLDQIRTKTHSKNRLELIGKITKSQLENLAIAL